MSLVFVPKEQDKAYISNSLWLPKRYVRTASVRKALEFQVPSQQGQMNVKMWDESSNHIICPREFLPTTEYGNYKFPFIDLRPQFQKAFFEDLVVPRNEEQERAWNALALNDNGILNLGCGKGKTKLALKKIAQRAVPTLIIVPDGGILEQWKDAIYGSDRTPPGLRFDGELGLIQGPTFRWACPVTLALISTLALRIRDGAVPEEMFRYFGLIVYDEVHQLGAPVFSQAAPPFYGDRIGLTATVQREDGLDPVFRYHIGEPFYTDLTQDLVPRIYFQHTPSYVPLDDATVNGLVNISMLRSVLGKNVFANVYRYWSIKEALDAGRKVLCLSHSKAQLRLLHATFPGAGLITKDTPKSERMDVLRNTNPCFAIAKLGSQGVDDDRLDTLFWLTPFRSKISLQQSMGRIQRALEGKKTPVMVVFEDVESKPLRNLCKAVKKSLREWNFSFDVCPPKRYPSTLPEDVRGAYAQIFNELQAEQEQETDDE